MNYCCFSTIFRVQHNHFCKKCNMATWAYFIKNITFQHIFCLCIWNAQTQLFAFFSFLHKFHEIVNFCDFALFISYAYLCDIRFCEVTKCNAVWKSQQNHDLYKSEGKLTDTISRLSQSMIFDLIFNRQSLNQNQTLFIKNPKFKFLMNFAHFHQTSYFSSFSTNLAFCSWSKIRKNP